MAWDLYMAIHIISIDDDDDWSSDQRIDPRITGRMRALWGRFYIGCKTQAHDSGLSCNPSEICDVVSGGCEQEAWEKAGLRHSRPRSNLLCSWPNTGKLLEFGADTLGLSTRNHRFEACVSLGFTISWPQNPSSRLITVDSRPGRHTLMASNLGTSSFFTSQHSGRPQSTVRVTKN